MEDNYFGFFMICFMFGFVGIAIIGCTAESMSYTYGMSKTKGGTVIGSILVLYLIIVLFSYNNIIVEGKHEIKQLTIKEQTSFDKLGYYKPTYTEINYKDDDNFIQTMGGVKISKNNIRINYKDLYPNSTSVKLDMEWDDLIYEINGNKISSLEDYTNILDGINDKDTISVKFLRSGFNQESKTTFKSVINKKIHKCEHHSHNEEYI